MDLPLFISISVLAFSAINGLSALLFRPPGLAGWFLANLAVFGLTGLALVVLPAWPAALAALLAFGLLIVLPVVFSKHAGQQSSDPGGRARAARLARWAALLHPTAQMRLRAHSLAAMAITDPDESAMALEALAASQPPAQARMLKALAATRRGAWDQALALGDEIPFDPGLLLIRLRALGELNRQEELLAAYQACVPHLPEPPPPEAQLFALAFTGQAEALPALFAHALKRMDADSQSFWLAVARFHNQALADQGRAELARLAASARDPGLRRAAARLLAQDLPPAAPLSEQARVTLKQIRTTLMPAIDGPAKDGPGPANAHTRAQAQPLTRTPVTLGLILLNLTGFALEAGLGVSEDLEGLVRLGALWPPLVLEAGEWWRLLSALFLHFGWVHLFANMLGLLVLGGLVETRQSGARLFAAYLLGGTASSLATLGWIFWAEAGNAVLMGASGAIFAILGVEAARRLTAWHRSRTLGDRQQLWFLGLILLVQFAIDLSVPEISLAAHLSGLVAGLLLGFAFVRFPPRPQGAVSS